MEFRTSTFKEFINQARKPEYRFVDGQMYDVAPLADFLLWLVDQPDNEETAAVLKTRTRPLPYWSFLYGRVAQVTDHNGILLWLYDRPEMTTNPTLVCLRNYPQERNLVDGNVVAAFAKNEGPYSYIDSQRSKSTIKAYDFGKPVTKAQVDLYLQKRSAPPPRPPPQAVHLPTNLPSLHRTNQVPTAN